jgi:predicted house-cleaning noncanonical NTP pyrophosphatase (MazG superfamily)
MLENSGGKLVRDNIPEIIRASGETPHFHVLSDEDYKHELIKKLLEEAQEFMEDPNLEERADIAEVLSAIDELFDFTPVQVKEAMLEKREKRGGFKKKIYLENDEKGGA